MKILVTGANGFIGSYLIEALIKQYPKSEIYGLIRAGANQDNILSTKKKIKLIRGDVLDYEKITRIIKLVKPDWLFHLAAKISPRFIKEADEQMLDINIIGTLNLLKSVKNYAPQAKFLYVSSASVYGNPPVRFFPIKENCPTEPIDAYGTSKACAEVLCKQYYLTFGLKTIIVRTFNILAPAKGQTFIEKNFLSQIKSIIRHGAPAIIKTGNLNTYRDFLDVRDVVEAYIDVIKKGHSGEIYNVCSNKTIRLQYLLDILLRYSGLKNKVKIIVDRQQVRTIEIKKSLGSNAKIRRHTAWTPKIPIKKSFMDLLENEKLLMIGKKR